MDESGHGRLGDSTLPVPRPSREDEDGGGDPAASEIAEDEKRPRYIRGYRITRRLGRGGMGDVFLAFDERLSRSIALKRLRADRFHSADARRRFEVEARVTAILQHPAVVPIYELFEEGGDLYYTMRPIEGVTLEEVLSNLREDRAGDEWPMGRLVRLFLQAAGAVAFAHSLGIIHRDLKPSNIMIGSFDEVLVLDWGMAKILGASEPRGDLPLPFAACATDTEPRVLIGTPAYMAPEQLRGEPASFKSDVFALGLILYEILAYEPPWRGKSIEEFHEAMKASPEMPTRRRPGRGIPAALEGAALEALAFDPARRQDSVSRLADSVAHALEGRAPWRLEGGSEDRRNWTLQGGTLSDAGDHFVIHSRGHGSRFQYMCGRRFPDSVQVEFEFSLPRGVHELSLWLNVQEPREAPVHGYELQILPGRRRTLSLLRSGRVVAGAGSPGFEPRSWHRVIATRSGDGFSLQMDAQEIYVHHDPIPLHGGFVGLIGSSDGLRLRGLRVHSLGASATVSCLSVPDAFFNRGFFEEARSEYESIAWSHPGRDEGRLAGFRAGLSLVEMSRRESDAEVRSLILADAGDVFSRLETVNRSSLGALGRAMVAWERGDGAAKREALAAAFEEFPTDPHLPAAREWLLGTLHAVDVDDRRSLAELLPVAIAHCKGGWSRRMLRDLLGEVRRSWEVPSFMISRSRFRESDRASHAEAVLFFAFWTGRAQLVERSVSDLLAAGLMRPYHVADAIFSLLEMDQPARARKLFEGLERELHGSLPGEDDRIWSLCRAAVLAGAGEVGEAERLLAGAPPNPRDRVYNGARLCVAREAFASGSTAIALRALRKKDENDSFAREHLAWFHLRLREGSTAAKQLSPLIARNDHRSGRNLANFLHGVLSILQGRQDHAERIFAFLQPAEWPRTWTLGSHYALGRLGRGSLERYLEGAFPWEKKQLRSQAALLAAARGGGEETLPEALRGPARN